MSEERWCRLLAPDDGLPEEPNGVAEWRVNRFEHFHDFLEHEVFAARTRPAHDLIWRGQRRSDWRLESSLDREFRRLGLFEKKEWGWLNERAKQHCESFRYSARGRRGPNPKPLEDDDWWAMGQHYGLATPLLDWTRSPFAAAFFAYEELGESNTDDVSIYVLDQEAVRLRIEANGEEVTSEFRFIDPMLDENPRLVSQGGVFTRTRVGMTVEDWVEAHFQGQEAPVLIKVNLPRADRAAALQSLQRMNINHLSLFPDLFGASLHANKDLELELIRKREIV